MKHMPLIKSVMTPFPYAVEIDAPLAQAQELMREHAIHHLPVIEHGELVGVVSDYELRAAIEGAADDAAVERRVREVYVPEPYVVDLNAQLAEVLRVMADRHIGSVLITRKGRLAGMFTLTDACRAFSRYLHDQYDPPGSGHDAA